MLHFFCVCHVKYCTQKYQIVLSPASWALSHPPCFVSQTFSFSFPPSPFLLQWICKVASMHSVIWKVKQPHQFCLLCSFSSNCVWLFSSLFWGPSPPRPLARSYLSVTAEVFWGMTAPDQSPTPVTVALKQSIKTAVSLSNCSGSPHAVFLSRNILVLHLVYVKWCQVAANFQDLTSYTMLPSLPEVHITTVSSRQFLKKQKDKIYCLFLKHSESTSFLPCLVVSFLISLVNPSLDSKLAK